MAKVVHNSLKQAALQVAVSQLGVCEEPKGSNSGKMVGQYLAAVGLKPGQPWCMAFVYWCFLQVSTKANPVPKTGGVLDCWNRTPTNRKLFAREIAARPELIEPGDQIILRHSAGTGHTGIVERVEGNMVHTIEGNTNQDGSREGFEVERKVRPVDTLFGVIRY